MMKSVNNYLKMATDRTASEAAASLINSDLKEIGDATKKFANHVVELGVSGGFVTTALQCGDVGKWITLVGVILRLFFPNHFPDYLVLPGALLLLIVVSPSFVAGYVRAGWIGVIICLIIGCYLLQEHIRASGGFRNAFTQTNGISNTIGIVLLFVFPVWALITLI
ncbi:hypothetical protein E3N88_34342 [Mikania micrantha]|uniref:Uncharacterized protein n=1 Tax=Mikania micrantha TaxID=192012 RepID=A0A5N6LY88_9ASTR|nr:hypothetical protein E3N88_34342 [Mikania micrantha]